MTKENRIGRAGMHRAEDRLGRRVGGDGGVADQRLRGITFVTSAIESVQRYR